MIQSVAVIGIGAMGAPVARRIQAAGFELIVCDRNPAALSAFEGAGARVAPTPAECAGVDLAIIFVANGQQVHDVILGEHGVMSGVMGRRAPIVAVMSTATAEALKDLAQTLRPLAVRLIDAPVTGGALKASQGGLTILTGGDPQDIDAAAPVFAALSNRQFYCGAHGAAQKMKIINNVVSISNSVLVGEAYRLALAEGLDITQVSRVLEAGTGRNFLSADPAGPQELYGTLVPDLSGFRSLVSILRKDIGVAADIASRTDENYPAIRAMQAVVDSLGDETFAHWSRIAESGSAGA